MDIFLLFSVSIQVHDNMVVLKAVDIIYIYITRIGRKLQKCCSILSQNHRHFFIVRTRYRLHDDWYIHHMRY